MSTNQPRRPAGVPVGGQWAPTSHDEADIELPVGPRPAQPSEVHVTDYRSLTEALRAAPAGSIVMDEHGCRATADGSGGYVRDKGVECARTDNRCDCFHLATQDDYDDEAAEDGDGDPSAEPEIRTDGGFSRDVDVVDSRTAVQGVSTAIANLVSLAGELGIGPEDLDDDVYDACTRSADDIFDSEREASAINNDGLDAQISYLIDGNGVAAVRRRLEHGTWGTVAPSPQAPDGWWPIVRTRSGETALSCPKCGASRVVISGSSLGSDVIRHNTFTSLECGSCGNSQHFPERRG